MRQAVRVVALAGCLVLLALPPPAAGQSTVSTAVFLGADVGPSARAIYGGAIVAVNGDLARDGVLLRGVGVYGWYDYLATLGGVDGKFSFFDAMIGYQFYRSNVRVAGYVGVEYQDHKLSPFDPDNRVVGNESGLKLAGDITIGYGDPISLNVMIARSTVFDTYWSRGRLGYSFGQFTLGPEALFGGNEGHDSARWGGFLTWRPPATPFDITISGGRHFVVDGGTFDKEGAYGALNIGFVF